MNNFYFLAISLIFASCTVDYDVDTSKITEPDRLVVNGILSPSQRIKIRFHAVERTDRYVCRPVAGVSVKLTENGVVVYEGVCPDTVLQIDYFPKTNAVYRIEARKENCDAVWAETTIPEAVVCSAQVIEKSDYRGTLAIARLYGFDNFGRERQSALYISSYGKYAVQEWDEETETVVTVDSVWVEASSLYSRNFFIDNINRMIGMPLVHEDVGSLYFENFMRIKAEYIPLLDTLAFAGAMQKIRIITAGTDYDRHVREAYEQSYYHSSMNSGMAEISAMFYQPVSIYSNINGGLGIFAGINGLVINN